MITTNGLIILEAASKVQFDTPDILCIPTIHDDAGTLITIAVVLYEAGTEERIQGGEYTFRSSLASIDAETGSGSGETAPFINAVQKAIKTVLLALNPSITFTIV